MRPAASRLIASLAVLATLAGCKPVCPATRLSVDELVGEYNANASRIGKLWARAKIEVKLPNGVAWGSVSPLASPNGLLLLEKTGDPLGPRNFALIGRETLAVDLFRLGSSAPQGVYYFWYAAPQYGGGAWWGRSESAGAPGVRDVPLDPNQLLSVLSVCELPADFTRIPTVALSMSDDPCAYVLTYLDRQPVSNRILFRREVYFHWSKRKRPRPFLVHLLDNTGRRVMTARLDDYRPVHTETEQGPPPEMPTRITLDWPAGKSSVRLVLSEMTTADTWDAAACRFDPPASIAPDDIVQVDADVEAGGDPK